MYKIDKTAAFIGVVFGIVTIIALIYLRIQEAFIVVLFWLILPVIFKKIVTFVKNFLKEGKGFK